MLVRLFALVLLSAAITASDQAAAPLGEPVMEAATLHCLGMHWIIRGDDNENATVVVVYRAAGASGWKPALPLHRVRKGAHEQAGPEKRTSTLTVPADAWLFAGSVLFLEPKTAYEVKLTLSDPDGGKAEATLTMTTMAEPALPPGGAIKLVVPGDGGGSGSASDPFKGLVAANAAAKPGDHLQLAAGTYAGEVEFTASGEPGKPIVWQGPASGAAVIDGHGKTRIIELGATHDVWLSRLVIAHALFGVTAHGAKRLVISRCRVEDVGYGLSATDGPGAVPEGVVIADNVLVGRNEWLLPFEGDAKGDAQWHDETRGITICGIGNVVCFNTVDNFKDGIDVCPGVESRDIDVHNNICTHCVDDANELDGSERNVRSYLNRYVDCHTGISVQPVWGGPTYAVRNTLYNIHSEPFKIHNSPSGCFFFHNTCLRFGEPFEVGTTAQSRDIIFRNNLFVGTKGRALNYDEPAELLDLDFDGFAGMSGPSWMKVYNAIYATIEDVRAKAPVEKHAVVVDPAVLFASGVQAPKDLDECKKAHAAEIDLRLKQGCAAIDAGEVLPNIDDGFSGSAPDLGAFEFGAPLPPYGPRPEKR